MACTALRPHCEAIIAKWLSAIFSTYPEDAARVFATRRDPFANPVGSTFRVAAERIVSLLIEGADRESLTPPLRDIIKIRAVQDFPPSAAIGFVFFLKDIVRGLLNEPSEDRPKLTSADLDAFDRAVDELALLAFDLYSEARERIAEIRIAETRHAMGKLLERAARLVANDKSTEALT